MKRTFLMPHWCKIAGLIGIGLVVVYWLSLWAYAGFDGYALGRLVSKMVDNGAFATADVIIHDFYCFSQIAVWQMFMILFLHIVMFNIAMAVIRRRRSHEE